MYLYLLRLRIMQKDFLDGKSGQTEKSCLSNFLHLLSYTVVTLFGHAGETLCDKY